MSTSQGQHARVLLEFKLLSNPKAKSGGPERQVPRYMTVEGTDSAFYVCVGFDDQDLSPVNCQEIETACSQSSTARGFSIIPVFIDARRRVSASRL